MHKQTCYLYEGFLDVPRKWMRKANPTKVPIDDLKDYFRVVFNEFFSNLKSDLLSRLSALAQQTVQGLQLSLQYGRVNGCRNPRFILSNIAGLPFELCMTFLYVNVVVPCVGILIISLRLRERVEDIQG